jgi:hypothetical protein
MARKAGSSSLRPSALPYTPEEIKAWRSKASYWQGVPVEGVNRTRLDDISDRVELQRQEEQEQHRREINSRKMKPGTKRLGAQRKKDITAKYQAGLLAAIPRMWKLIPESADWETKRVRSQLNIQPQRFGFTKPPAFSGERWLRRVRAALKQLKAARQ